MFALSRILYTPDSVIVESLSYPASFATRFICFVSALVVHVSAAYPRSFGFIQAMLISQVLASPVISSLRPRPSDTLRMSIRLCSSVRLRYFWHHSSTVCRLTPSSAAISLHDLFSALLRRILARWLIITGVMPDLTSFSSSVLSSGRNVNLIESPPSLAYIYDITFEQQCIVN